MIVTTIERIDGMRIVETKGLIYSKVGQVRGLWGQIICTVEMIVGGEGKAYAESLQKAKDAILKRAIAEAESLGCNAILGCDIDITEVRDGYLLASLTGTGVVLEKI